MKIKIIQSCGIKGAHAEAGASIDIDDHIAHDLIAMGKAVKHSGGSSQEKKPSKKAKS
jgi:hypothetical protein